MAIDTYLSLASQLIILPGVEQVAFRPPASVDVTYAAGATDQQRAAAQALIAGWDWSDAAQQARDRAAKRAAAKASLTGADPVQSASRNALRVIYQSIVETRQALNPLLVAAGQPPLPIRNWKQALAAVRQQIDAETDPEA